MHIGRYLEIGKRGVVLLAASALVALTSCTSVSVDGRGSRPLQASQADVARGCRFQVGVFDASDMTIRGDGDWDQERNARDRQALQEQLRADVLGALQGLGLRAARHDESEPLAGDVVLVEALVSEFDRGSAMNRVGRSSLTCRFRLLRGPERRVGAEFAVTSRAQVPSGEIVERHCALVLEHFVEQLKVLLDQ